MAFTFTKLTGLLVCTSALMAAGAVQAQERAAASSLETQMTWSTLSKLVEAANANSVAANARVNQVEKCNLKYKLYAPEGKKKGLSVDGDGCIFNQPLLDLTDRVKKTEDAITDTNKKLGELETYTKTEIKRIDGTLASLTETVSKLDTRVDKVEKGLSTLTDRVKVVEGQIVTVNAKIAALTDRVDAQDVRLDKQDKKIAVLEKDVADAKTRLTAAEKRLTAAEDAIKDNTADIKTNTADIAALEKEVAAAKTRLTTAENLLKTHTAQIAALDKDVTAVEKRVTTAEGTIKTHTSQITAINADIVAINKEISALEKDVSALDTRLTSAETELNKVLACGKSDKLYNPTTKKCVSPASDEAVVRRWFSLTSRTLSAGNGVWADSAVKAKFIKDLEEEYAGITACPSSMSIARPCGAEVKTCYDDMTALGSNIGGDNDRWMFTGYKATVYRCQ